MHTFHQPVVENYYTIIEEYIDFCQLSLILSKSQNLFLTDDADDDSTRELNLIPS